MAYKNADIIEVKSLVKNSQLVFIDTDNITHIWEEYGDVLELTWRDLKKMATSHKRFFKDCWVRIPDDAAKQLKLKNYLLDSKIDLERIDTLFTMKPEKFEEFLIGSSDGVQDRVVDAAIEKLRKDELDSLKILRIIKNITGKDIEETARIIEGNDKAKIE